MKKLSRRLWAGILAICLMVGFVPVGAQAALVEGSDYLTQQLYLGDSLMFHLRGNTDYPYAENAVATLSWAGGTKDYRLEDLDVCDNGQRELVVDLAAAQMTEDLDLNIRVGSTEILDETYRVEDYLSTLIEGKYSNETKALCYELLNYGAWAQRYFDYRTEDVAGDQYDLTAGYSIPSEYPAMTPSGKVTGIRYYGASVRFDSKLAVRFYFAADGDVSGYTFSVDGVSYTPAEKDGMYYIEVPGINPQDMDTPLNVSVTDGSTTLSFCYITTDFFVRSYHKATDETYQNLLTAAYSYFMAAKAFASIGTLGDLDFTYQGGSSKTIQVLTTLPSDTPLSDFALNENGCSVNEDANLYQAASKVTMEQADGDILLTFCFDSDFTENQTYTLPKNAVFGFTDGKQYALTKDYIFLFNGTDWSIVEPEGDFRTGVGFEDLGNTLLFTGQGLSGQDGTIARVAYSDLGIATPSDGGSYALRLSHTDGDPTFRIEFGRELAARTELSFVVYNTGTKSSFGISQTDTVTGSVYTKTWTKLTITLPEKAEYIDLYWNTNGSGGTVYLDNFLATEPEEAANLLLGFESYQEVTGTKIAVGNKLGRMEINRDIRYISQGEGSLKVSPQGDYSKPGYHPYFKLDLLDTTAKFSDLSEFKSISFDVYNAESESLHIGVCLVTGEDYEAYLSTNLQTFTLEPNSWTTCTYDLSYLAGYNFCDLVNVRYIRFEFEEHKQSKTDVPNVLYIDNLRAEVYADGEGPVAAVYDYTTGIDFETSGQEYLFTGQSIQDRDAQIERVLYYSNGSVAAPSGGGSYGVRLRHESNYWPTFRLYFGQELPAGTEITFIAYGKVLNSSTLYNQSIFEFSDGGEATEQFACGQWTQLYLTLPENASYIDLFWNYDRAGVVSSNASGEVYIDNIIIVQNEPYGDILEGYGFEERGNAERFTGQGNDDDATIKRMTYEMAGITAQDNGGDYVLRLTHSSSMTPNFRINFGKKLACGTVITFDAYAVIDSGYVYPKKNVIQYSDGTAAVDKFDFKVWNTLSITLQEEAEYIDLIWSFKGTFGSAVSSLYIDNIQAEEPEAEVTGDFLEGVDFETAGNEKLFGAVGGDYAWRDATLGRAVFDGDYALKLTCESSQWPVFRINFGKTLTAGTVLTFDAYTNDTSGIRETVSVFEYLSGGDATAQYYHGSWNTLSITLASDCTYLDLVCNMDRWNEPGPANIEVYMDNFKAVESAVTGNALLTGLSFEADSDTAYFTGQSSSNDAVIARVSYTSEGMTAPTDGGSYALKLSHDSFYWPTFRINFGKTLKAGTVITFVAYGKITSGTSLYNQSIFEFSSGSPGGSGEATEQFSCDSWTELTITLTEDVEYIDLFWNYDRASITSTTASGAVYIDNVKATEPT